LSKFFEVDVSTLLGKSGDDGVDGVEMMIVAQYPRSGHDGTYEIRMLRCIEGKPVLLLK
jgi:hypothetical protein